MMKKSIKSGKLSLFHHVKFGFPQFLLPIAGVAS